MSLMRKDSLASDGESDEEGGEDIEMDDEDVEDMDEE